MTQQVLLVDTDGRALNLMAAALRDAGYAPTVAATWEDASALLKVQHFPFLVTAHRLGAHNGLHLVLRARADAAGVATIVTTPASDPVLEREAASFGALTLVAPWEHGADLVTALERVKSIQPS
jgi:ActR/RegA family two-component response regulator